MDNGTGTGSDDKVLDNEVVLSYPRGICNSIFVEIYYLWDIYLKLGPCWGYAWGTGLFNLRFEGVKAILSTSLTGAPLHDLDYLQMFDWSYGPQCEKHAPDWSIYRIYRKDNIIEIKQDTLLRDKQLVADIYLLRHHMPGSGTIPPHYILTVP